MSWLKVSDRALAEPRFTRVSRDARLLHLEAMAWTMAYGDGDGSMARHSLRRATDANEPEALATELVEAGLWTGTDDGWQVTFMLDDQLSPDEIARQRAFNRTRQARYRRHSAGDHSMCEARFCNAVRNAVNNGAVTTPRLDPTRPQGGTKVEARSAASADAPAASLARRKKRPPMSDEHRRSISKSVRESNERKRLGTASQPPPSTAEELAASEAQWAAELAAAQAERDAEWLALGGDPRRVGRVTSKDIWQRQHPGRRPLR